MIDNMKSDEILPRTILDSAITAVQETRYGKSDANVLHRLEALAEMQVIVTMVIRDEVEIARSFDHSWAEIGAALGFTRQAAQQRFGLSE